MTCRAQTCDYRNPGYEYDWEKETQNMDDKFFGRVTYHNTHPAEIQQVPKNTGKNRMRSEQEFFDHAWCRRLECGEDIPDKIQVHNTGDRTVAGDVTYRCLIRYNGKNLNWPGGHKMDAIAGEKEKFRATVDRINFAAKNTK